MKQGRLYVFSGPSGAGKGTICDKLVEDDVADLSVSMTTRALRGAEVDGVSYYFVSHEEFQKTIDEGGLLEWAEVYNNRYGTPKKPVLDKLETGRDVILEIEMQGAMKVKKAYPDAVLVFVLPPSLAILKERLRGRGTDSEEQIALRTKSVIWEIRQIVDYDYYLINGELDEAVENAKKIMRGEFNPLNKDSAQKIIRRYEEELEL